MKNYSYKHYINLILKSNTNPYLYVSTYKEAKQKLQPFQFKKFQKFLRLEIVN